MSDVIKGYQFSPVDGRFIGEYEFPNNQDRDEIHLPPFTTLEPPPVGDSNDIAFFVDGEWILEIVPNEPFIPPIDDYAMITEGFIDYLKAIGKWTDEDQKKRDDAIAALAESGKNAA